MTVEVRLVFRLFYAMNKRQYIEYLIATPTNYTCTNLTNHLQGEQAVSHDAICDYLRREKLTPRGLWEVIAPLLYDSPEAYLIVDDSVQDKCYSHKIEMVKLQYSGAEGGVLPFGWTPSTRYRRGQPLAYQRVGRRFLPH